MGEEKLHIEIRSGAQPAETVVALEGVLNADTAFRFRDAVREYESANLVLDMSGLRSMDSSGLGVLIGLYVTFERTSGRLMLTGLNDRVWNLFRMCKIEDVFTRYGTVAEAEETLSMAGAVTN